jgi:hypothetical protein
LGALVALAVYAYSFNEYVRDYHLQPGEQPSLRSSEGRGALWDIALAAPTRLLRSLRAGPIEQLQLDIGFRHFQKIVEKREQALRRSFLITSREDFVPATLRHRGRELRVRVRLKGDLTDHLLGDKWSYRVVVRDGQSLLGMRRFSLQAPYTRDFQAEPLFFDFLREWGVLAPRYFFVDLTVNGRRVGRMALEEHFSTELLEHQRRRAGAIVRFDEQYFYQAELAFMELVPDYDNWRNVPVEAFRRRCGTGGASCGCASASRAISPITCWETSGPTAWWCATGRACWGCGASHCRRPTPGTSRPSPSSSTSSARGESWPRATSSWT